MADTPEKAPSESKFVRVIGFIALILFVGAIFVGFLTLNNDVAKLKLRVDKLEAKVAGKN